MKISTLTLNEVSPQMVDLISRLVDLIPWPVRRQAMGDVTLSLLDGKHRVCRGCVWLESNYGGIGHE